MREENPFRAQGSGPVSAGPTVTPGRAATRATGSGVTIPFEVGDRKLFGRTGLWMTLAGVGNLVVGAVTLVSLVVVEFSVFGLVRSLLWIAVSVLTLLAARALARIETPSSDDLLRLDEVFAKIRLLFAVKAGAALAAIALALTVWRLAIQYGMQ